MMRRARNGSSGSAATKVPRREAKSAGIELLCCRSRPLADAFAMGEIFQHPTDPEFIPRW